MTQDQTKLEDNISALLEEHRKRLHFGQNESNPGETFTVHNETMTQSDALNTT